MLIILVCRFKECGGVGGKIIVLLFIKILILFFDKFFIGSVRKFVGKENFNLKFRFIFIFRVFGLV